MKIISTPGWDDYELIDSGDGQKLERFGPYILNRPDPQIIWHRKGETALWSRVHAYFEKGKAGEGKWIYKSALPDKWEMRYKNLRFYAKLTPFKHTGVFPEQCVQWDWIVERISHGAKEPNILNLFAYTGIATLACAVAGAKVTHLEASKPTIGWARENQKLSGLSEKPIRWILDDAIKFCQRELRRGVRYDGIIMDPPIYGHGPDGETWDFNRHFPILIQTCRELLSDSPLFMLVNTYAISSSSLMLENVLKDHLSDLDGSIEVGELALEEKTGHRLLSTGIFGRWSGAKTL